MRDAAMEVLGPAARQATSSAAKYAVKKGPELGVINFHEVGPRLSLVEVNLDHAPSGIIEKISRGARFTKRAVCADLHRFQAWVEM